VNISAPDKFQNVSGDFGCIKPILYIVDISNAVGLNPIPVHPYNSSIGLSLAP